MSLLTSLACAADQKPRQRELFVNVNTASFEDLKTIPCVEDERATGIFKHRPYKTIDDLLNVPSIGPKILECMSPCIKVTGKTEQPKGNGA
jgi:DNA uptake protein ComE-like DNA-binding protein